MIKAMQLFELAYQFVTFNTGTMSEVVSVNFQHYFYLCL